MTRQPSAKKPVTKKAATTLRPPSPERRIFAENVWGLRTKLEMTRKELSALTGIHHLHISIIETQKKGPTIDTMGYIAAALGVPLYRLLMPGVPDPPQLPDASGQSVVPSARARPGRRKRTVA